MHVLRAIASIELSGELGGQDRRECW
jgi:hypothetical protein